MTAERMPERTSQDLRGKPQISLASKVIAALRTLDTGQFFSASTAIRANVASSRFALARAR
jgi:hypothetical protein